MRCVHFLDFDCRRAKCEEAEPWVLVLELPTSAFAPSLCHAELWNQAIAWSHNREEVRESVQKVWGPPEVEESELSARGLEEHPVLPDMPNGNLNPYDMKACVFLGMRSVLHPANFKWKGQDYDMVVWLQWILLLLQESFTQGHAMTTAKLNTSAHKLDSIDKLGPLVEELERNARAAIYEEEEEGDSDRDGDGDGGGEEEEEGEGESERESEDDGYGKDKFYMVSCRSRMDWS